MIDRLAAWWQDRRSAPKCLNASPNHFPPHLCGRPKGHPGQHKGAHGPNDWWPR